MKQKLLQSLMFIALLLTSTHAFAHDFEAKNSDGVTIYYDIISSTDKTCEVTFRGSSYGTYSNEYTGSIIIPETVTYDGTTYSVTSIGNYAFDSCTGLTSITIPNSVTSIGSYAFYDCTGLTSITIPNSVTSIGERAFRNCSSLTSVTIPNSVTSIGESAFYSCSGLTTIKVETGNSKYDSRNNCNAIIETESNTLIVGCMSTNIPNSVTGIGDSAFSWCNGLTSVTIPNSVTSIEMWAFGGCTGLTSITIPNSVTSIGFNAFYGCTGLTSITIGNSVTSIGNYAFDSCTGLTSITIPNSVTSIGQDPFYGCNGLTTIKVETGNSKYDSRNNCNAIIETESNTLIVGCMSTNIPNSVTSIRGAFKYCTGLTSITIPNSVTSIGDYAFRNCTGLTSITIPNSVTSIGNFAFNGCSGLTSISIPNSVTSIGENAFYDTGWYNNQPDGILYLDNCCLGYKWEKPTGYITLKEQTRLIAGYAFAGCSGLTSITIPNSVTSIGDYAFRNCTGLTSITIPNSVTSIGNFAFNGCSSLSSVTIPNSVTIIGDYAFYGCSGLTTIKVETGNSKYDSRNNCNAIIETESNTLIAGCKNTIIPSNVTSIGDYAFRNCTGLTSVTIPNSVTSIGSATFYGCTGLTSITIPNSVTSIGNYAFYGCSGLTSITISNSVTSIGNGAFKGTGWYNNQPDGILYLDNCCLGYKGEKPTGYITLKEQTRLIAGYAFYYCTGLTSVTIPNSVTSIGNRAFYDTGWYNNQPDGILYLDNCCLGYKGEEPAGYITLKEQTRLITDYAFYNCSGLTSVTIPNSVTGIGDYAFSWCKSLTSITIGVKVSTIGRCAFYEDYNIRTITCKAKNPPTCGTDVFKSVKVESVQLTVPKESVSLYQTADTWLDFYITGAEFSGIEEKLVDDNENTTAVYYNLQGVKVENPERGLYIKRQGSKISKVIL